MLYKTLYLYVLVFFSQKLGTLGFVKKGLSRWKKDATELEIKDIWQVSLALRYSRTSIHGE